MDVLIVEDHAMFRDVIEGILVDRIGCKVVVGTESCESARIEFAKRKFDLVVCDIDLPDGDGVDLADEFSLKDPRLRMIAVSSQVDEFTLSRVLRSTMIGFVDKTRENVKSLEHALREVSEWRTYYAATIHQYKMAERMNPNTFSKILSEKELEMMRFFGVGLRNEEIAEKTGLSIHTIHSHRRNVLSKLGLSGTHELVRYAFSKGFTRASDMIRQSAAD